MELLKVLTLEHLIKYHRQLLLKWRLLIAELQWNIEEGGMVDPWKADIYSLGVTLLAMMYPEIETRNDLLGMLV